MEFPTRTEIESIKKQYPVGTVIMLDHMDDIQAPPKGTKGTVTSVDDIGQLHINWENGSTLALVPGIDKFHTIKMEE